MNGMKNDTYIISNKGSTYKVEAWTNGKFQSMEFKDLIQASELRN